MQLDWEIWLDTHLSSILAKWIKDEFGSVVKSNYVLQLNSMTDEQIFLKAKAAGEIIIITRDIDFRLLLAKHGPPPKVLKLNHDNMDNRELFEFLTPTLEKNIRLLIDFNQNILEFPDPIT